MKKIINGKRYNTETAERVATWANNYYGGDFQQCEKTLYRTPRGNWFTVGSGGPLSEYAVSYGNGRSGRSDVFRTCTEKKAQELLEDWGETEALELYFSDIIEDA